MSLAEVDKMFPETSGKTIAAPFGPIVEDNKYEYALSMLQLEYPVTGTGDYREPAFVVEQPDGGSILHLKYKTHEVMTSKPEIPGMPSLRSREQGDCACLKITLADGTSGVEVSLYYCIFRDLSVVSRWVNVTNTGDENVFLDRVLSASLDLEENDWTWMYVSGHWAREQQIQEEPLGSCCIKKIQSLRGTSSHHHNPFCVLRRNHTTERDGEAVSMHLVYSGNFMCQAEVDPYDRVRMQVGVNPVGFKWKLAPGGEFHTPECVLSYTMNGLGALSRTHHKLYRTHLFRSYDQPRPVVFNAWEALTFDVNEKVCFELAEQAQTIGVELFVIDDGWFKARNDDQHGLGDWTPDPVKFPRGLEPTIERVHELGMMFGLWVEPEMISPKSELFAAHPEWVLQVRGRKGSTCRNQWLLDLSRKDVQDYIIGFMRALLGGLAIDYIKWDMNRSLSEVGSLALPSDQQQEVFHRYVLGLYRVLEILTREFPNVLFENCSGGGGRMDPGMLHYMHQSWTSDNTDAYSRVKIQYGSSLFYPISVLTGHVSEVPNQQTNRTSSMHFRGAVSLSTLLGYELNLLHASDEDKAQMREQIEFYKSIRHIVETGEFFRLKSPFTNDEASWMFVTEDKREAYFSYYVLRKECNLPNRGLIKLQGLDDNASYVIEHGYNQDNRNAVTGVFSGHFLMKIGFRLPSFTGDCQAYTCVLRRTEAMIERTTLTRLTSEPETHRDLARGVLGA
jgi:alpha-galactosidase